MSDWKAGLWRLPGVRKALSLRSNLLAHAFDWRHRVKTCGEEDPGGLTVVGDNVSQAAPYVPTTPRAGRYILRDLPVADVSNYTFIDMGSGKGRMLLLAAELPFRRIVGVEFASDLNVIAQNNARSYRNPKQRCTNIESLNMDAAEYEFPNEPSLLYFFYPFHQMLMQAVIQNLDRSLSEHPRDVILVYLNPVLAGVVEAASHLKLYARKTHFSLDYAIFRSFV